MIRISSLASSSCFALAQNLRFTVTWGLKKDEWEVERTAAIAQCMPEACEDLEAPTTEYTYIALILGALYVVVKTGEVVMTQEDQHITIAYLPATAARTRRMLLSSLDRLLDAWLCLNLQPMERPYSEELLPMRKCIVGDSHQDQEYRNLAHIAPVTINQHLDAKRIVLATPTFINDGSGGDDRTLEPVAQAIVRMHRRDICRVEAAKEIEKATMASARQQTTVHVGLTKNKIRPTSEVASLLHYVRETLIYKHGVYHMQPRRDVGLLDSTSWHVSLINRANEAKDFIPIFKVEDHAIGASITTLRMYSSE